MTSGHDTDELGQRLRTLVAHHVPAPARERHLAAIAAELARLANTATTDATRDLRSARWRVRRWLAGVATAATVLTPAGVAVAAQGAVPGDALYTVKRVTEQVHVLVDPDVIARHRITELATLLDGDAPSDALAAAAAAARDAVAALPHSHRLHQQLAEILARMARLPAAGTGDDDAQDLRPPGRDASDQDDDHEPEADEPPANDADDGHDNDDNDGDDDEANDQDNEEVDDGADGEANDQDDEEVDNGDDDGEEGDDDVEAENDDAISDDLEERADAASSEDDVETDGDDDFDDDRVLDGETHEDDIESRTLETEEDDQDDDSA